MFAQWVIQIILHQDRSFVRDLFEMENYPTWFLKAQRVHFSKAFYKRNCLDSFKYDTCTTTELVKLGKTSLVRKNKWVLRDTNEVLVDADLLIVVIDTKTRRPHTISEAYRKQYAGQATDPNRIWKLVDKRPGVNSRKLAEFQHKVDEEDIDFNNHFNAYNYHLYCLEALVKSTDEPVYVKDFTINLKNEALLGDLINGVLWEVEQRHYICELWKGKEQESVALVSAEICLHSHIPETRSKI